MSRGSGTVVRGTVEYRNTAEPCEDMPRKSLDIRFTDYPVPQKRGLLRPFPAFRRGRVRAEPANGSRDESLVGFGATPQGLKTINICNFQGSLEPVFSAQFFHRLLDTTLYSGFPSVSGRGSVCSLFTYQSGQTAQRIQSPDNPS